LSRTMIRPALSHVFIFILWGLRHLLLVNFGLRPERLILSFWRKHARD
jgi:hypothetical protein